MASWRLSQDPGLPVANPTRSYWQEPPNQDLLNIHSPVLPKERDVIVIGSGITGMSVCWWLLKNCETTSVTVLDAREICSGATGRNGGRIHCTAVQDYIKYERLFGHDTAVDIVRFELDHFAALEAVAREAGLEVEEFCQIRSVDAITVFFDQDKLVEFQSSLQRFEQAFPDWTGCWKIIDGNDAAETYRICDATGALVGRAGAVWPYRLVTSVFARLHNSHYNRFSLEANTPAISISSSSDSSHPYTVVTPRGEIRARHIVHCTEGHASHLLPHLRGILVPRRGQMTAQSPPSHIQQCISGSRSWSFLTGDTLTYATEDPSARTIFIGGGETRGKDVFRGISSDAEEDVSALCHLYGMLPVAFGRYVDQREDEKIPWRKDNVSRSWTGILCDSLDGCPLVGMIPDRLLDGRPRGSQMSAEWISAGYGGYGMVNSFLCGLAVAKMIGGKEAYPRLPEPYLLTSQRVERLYSIMQQSSGLD